MVVLIVMIALLGLGMTGLFLTSGSMQMDSNINLRNQALVVAEAGIERARAVLNNPVLAPNIPALLSPAVANSADDPIQTTEQCQGERRGAVLRDNGAALVGIDYPTVSRSSDLPGTGGGPALVSSTMGKYTVYIRQDVRDCRMGNFTCDTAPGSVDGGVVVGVEACATPPPAGVPPNNVVIVRSEGLASDGKTRVVLEVTMSPGHGGGLGNGPPLSALCASGANGCDDNASVQGGIVVNPGPEPSLGGASGSGAGGTTGAAGAAGSGDGGSGTGPLPGDGGAGGTAGLPGGGGGSGGGGTGGSLSCPGKYGARVATMGVWGVWNAYVSPSANDSGSAMFRAFLDENFGGCQSVGSITSFGGGQLTKEDLDPYNVLILLDLFHTNADRWQCVSHWDLHTSSGIGIPSCGWNLACYQNGNGLPQWCPLIPGLHESPPSWPCDSRYWNAYDSANNCVPAVRDCTKCPAGTTTYMAGHQPLLTSAELAVIADWLRAGNGLVTTMGYYYTAAQARNTNSILRQIGLAYQTTDGADTSPVVKTLDGNYGYGSDVCAAKEGVSCPGTWSQAGDNGGDFRRTDGTTPGHYPFDFVKPVSRLEVRGAVPIMPVTPTNAGLAATVERAVRAQCTRPLPSNDRCNANSPVGCDDTQPRPGSYWRDVGYTVKDIRALGDPAGSGGRIVVWGDEWLTYNTLWSAWRQDTYDIPQPTPCATSPAYQAAEFWENVVSWLACGKDPTAKPCP